LKERCRRDKNRRGWTAGGGCPQIYRSAELRSADSPGGCPYVAV